MSIFVKKCCTRFAAKKQYVNTKIPFPLEIVGNICYNMKCFDIVEQCRTVKLIAKAIVKENQNDY